MCYDDNELMTDIYYERVEYIIFIDEYAISTVITDKLNVYNHVCESMIEWKHICL